MLLRLGRASQRAEAAGLTGEPNLDNMKNAFRSAVTDGINQGLSGADYNKFVTDRMDEAFRGLALDKNRGPKN